MPFSGGIAALLPDFMLEGDLKQGALIRLLPNYPMEQTDAWMVSSPQRYRSLAVQTVLDYLAGVGGSRHHWGRADWSDRIWHNWAVADVPAEWRLSGPLAPLGSAGCQDGC